MRSEDEAIDGDLAIPYGHRVLYLLSDGGGKYGGGYFLKYCVWWGRAPLSTTKPNCTKLQDRACEGPLGRLQQAQPAYRIHNGRTRQVVESRNVT